MQTEPCPVCCRHCLLVGHSMQVESCSEVAAQKLYPFTVTTQLHSVWVSAEQLAASPSPVQTFSPTVQMPWFSERRQALRPVLGLRLQRPEQHSSPV